jgi:2-amino-4-hydroxy-6-hydroxymethyldihydropteridine diphosphokinase
MTQLAYLSLGSNIESNGGEREEHLCDAIKRLETLGRLVAISSFYETEPVEVADQGWFLNCAVALETGLTPVQLMAAILRIEQAMGRRRSVPKGPRTIDIDIVLYGDAIVNSTELTIPHPAMARRRFVLEPLAEIAAEVRHPILKKAVREMLEELPVGQTVKKFAAR